MGDHGFIQREKAFLWTLGIGCVAVALLIAALTAVGGWLFYSQLLPAPNLKLETMLFENTDFVRSLSNLELVERGTTEFISRSEELDLWPGSGWGALSRAEYESRFKVVYTYIVSADRIEVRFADEDGNQRRQSR